MNTLKLSVQAFCKEILLLLSLLLVVGFFVFVMNQVFVLMEYFEFHLITMLLVQLLIGKLVANPACRILLYIAKKLKY